MRSASTSLRHTINLPLYERYQRFFSSCPSRQSFPNAAPRFGAFAHQRDEVVLPVTPAESKVTPEASDAASRHGAFVASRDQGSLSVKDSKEGPTIYLSDAISSFRDIALTRDDIVPRRINTNQKRLAKGTSGAKRFARDSRPPQLPEKGSIFRLVDTKANHAPSAESADLNSHEKSNGAIAWARPRWGAQRDAVEENGKQVRSGLWNSTSPARRDEASTYNPPARSGPQSQSYRNRSDGFSDSSRSSRSAGMASSEKFSGWADRSQVERYKAKNTGKWGVFEVPSELETSAPSKIAASAVNGDATIAQQSKTAGILSRHKRRQGRYEDEEDEDQPRKKDYKRKSSRRDRQEDEDDDRSYKMEKADYMAAKEARKKKKAEEALKAREQAEQKRWQIKLPPYISVANLAKALNVRYEDFVARMQTLGFKDLSHDYVLTTEDAGLVAMEYGFDPIVEASSENIVPAAWPTNTDELDARPPVVTIMGHVDHGKTTILDYLRKSSIAAGEFGGITQHIGAFSVPLSSGKTITFLDTPGHAAFLSMRQRGATVTDIVVLVVAADDGVMPQTLEAIKHAKAANVPMIVAVNKVDRGEANVDRVKQDLSRHDVDIEDNGGDIQVVPVSGKTGQGMGDLEESIITLSEILDHKAPQAGNVEGWILEASTKAHGRVATVLVRRGVMRPGDIFVSGTTWGRVKTIRNEFGTQVDSAGPGTAAEIDGWRDDLPSPGDEVLQADDERHAAAVVRTRSDLAAGVRAAQDMEAINDLRRENREIASAADDQHLTLHQRRKNRRPGIALDADSLRERKIDGTFREVARRQDGLQEAFFVIKADVEGSVEAVVDLVASLGNARVRPNIVRASAGAVTESDVELAYAAQAHILAFNTDIDNDIRARADRAGVRVVEQRVIYRVAETVNAILADLLPEIVSQRVTGEAEVLQAFSIRVAAKVAASRQIVVAGCRVRNGVVARGSRVRVMRAGAGVVYEGTVESLRNVKKDVAEMKKDTECGMVFGDGWQEFRTGDQVQCYSETREKDKLV